MKYLLPLLLALLTGCASTLPPGIAEAPPGNPAPGEVRQAPDRFEGAQVRWGGTIAGVENQPDYTLVEVVARPLQDNGRPRDTDRTLGRFLARVPGFLDPVVYEPGRAFTVAGPVQGVTVRPVGDYPYRYPTVAAESYQLWEPLPERDPLDYYGPFWHDPLWYSPWHRWYWPYPYPPPRR